LDAVSPLTAESRQLVPIAYRVQCSAQKLEKKDPGILAKSDPFFVIKSLVGKKIILWRSEVIKQQCDVTWNTFDLRVEDVGGFDSEFEVYVYDWDADGGHDEIGRLTVQFHTSFKSGGGMVEFRVLTVAFLADYPSKLDFWTIPTKID